MKREYAKLRRAGKCLGPLAALALVSMSTGCAGILLNRVMTDRWHKIEDKNWGETKVKMSQHNYVDASGSGRRGQLTVACRNGPSIGVDLGVPLRDYDATGGEFRPRFETSLGDAPAVWEAKTGDMVAKTTAVWFDEQTDWAALEDAEVLLFRTHIAFKPKPVVVRFKTEGLAEAISEVQTRCPRTQEPSPAPSPAPAASEETRLAQDSTFDAWPE